MRAAIYARVSTAEQAAEGYSIGVQKEKLKRYAQAQDYAVANIYADEGFSGKSLSRPAVESLIADIKAARIDIVLIYKLDRLSRHVKDVLELVELFEKYNVTLYSLNENLDLSSPFGRAALKMSATFSELERETIVERMEMGKTARAKSGRYTCPGPHCPFGYRHDKENDRLEIVPQQAEAIRDMFDRYINAGFSFRKLYEYCKEKYPSIGFFSNAMSCKPVIKRSLYAGYFSHKGELIRATNLEPIIPYETYLKAQAVIEKNKTTRRRDNSPYLLTGLVYCAQCGNRYVGKLYDRYNKRADGGATKHYLYRTYGCAARVKRDKAYRAAECRNEVYDAKALDETVEAYVRALQFDEFKESGFVPDAIDALDLEQAALSQKAEKLLDLYIDGNIDKETYIKRKEEIDKKRRANANAIEGHTEAVQKARSAPIALLKERLRNYDKLSRKDKALLLSFLIKSVVIDGESITINLSVQ